MIIIAGPNGAGKSTLAPFLLRDKLGVPEFVNADTIAHGLSAFAPESVAFEAGRVLLKRLRALAAQRRNFAFETTPATRSYAGWLRQLRLAGYAAHLVFLWLRDVGIAFERVKERVRAGGHYVPDEVIRRKSSRGVQNFFGLYQHLVSTWAVYDPSIVNAPTLIAAGEERLALAVFNNNLWFQLREAAQ